MTTTKTTNTRIIKLGRALLGPRGIADVPRLVSTVVAYRNKPGHVRIDRRTGGSGGWFAAPHRTELTRDDAILGFDGDFRRDSDEARRLIARGLEDLLSEANISDPDEGRIARPRKASGKGRPPFIAGDSARLTQGLLGWPKGEVVRVDDVERKSHGSTTWWDALIIATDGSSGWVNADGLERLGSATKKTAAQLDQEVDDALGRGSLS